jgi:hypothetical protein
MKQWLKRITGLEEIEQSVKRLEELKKQELAAIAAAKELRKKEEELADLAAQQAKKQKELAKLSPKKRATKDNEPYIDIVKVDLDAENPSYGSFELDWNEHFVKKLRDLGYPGESDEVVVDLWFQSVCRNILMETYEQEAANRSDNIRYISRRDLGDGKTEVR